MVEESLTLIRKIRLEKNLTQEFVAVQLDISQSSFARIENGQSLVKLDTFFKILNALEIKPYDFFSRLNK